MRPMTSTQQRALKVLGEASITRPRRSFEWFAAGSRFPLIVIAGLRKRGFARITTMPDQLQASITESGRAALAELQ